MSLGSGQHINKAWNPLTATEVVGDQNTNKQAHAFDVSTLSPIPRVLVKFPTFQLRDSKCEMLQYFKKKISRS